MSSLWIVHREAAGRAALARLAGAPQGTPAGAPGAPDFETAAAPALILLGLSGDLEAELEFTHRTLARLPRSRWILVGDAARLATARRLFGALPDALLAYPPQAHELRAAIRAAQARPDGDPLGLSERRLRDALSERFARVFGDLELPGLMRALDPRMLQVPLLILGEPGSGRGTLARYLHHFAAGSGGALVELDCAATSSAAELLATLAALEQHPSARARCTLWLADAEQLSPALQRRVGGWIHHGPPAASLSVRAIRWLATAHEHGLEPGLRQAVGGITLRVPPLRERRGAVARLAAATAAAWCRARGERPRALGQDALAVLEEYPWPGNVRELEAVVEQSLSASGADPLRAGDLRLDGEPLAPPEEAAEPGSGPEPEPEVMGELVEELTQPRVLEEPAEPVVMGEPEAEERELEAALADLTGGPAQALGPGEAPSRDLEETTRPGDLTRLAASVGHELRNPLTAVRTFAELLRERYADPEFRERFAGLVGESLTRVERVLDRLERLAELPAPRPVEVDAGRLLAEVLEERRPRIRERRLVVLEELDRGEARARVDRERLRFAFEALLDKAFELVPERGDVYLAARQQTAASGAPAGVRVLLRFRGGAGAAPTLRPEMAPAANALEFAVADLVVRGLGGRLTLDTRDARETVVLVDLPA